MTREHPRGVALAVVASLALAGCAHEANHPAAPAAGSSPSRAVPWVRHPGTGKPQEATVLVDEPGLKVVSIALNGGTVMPPHHSPASVTVQAVEGRGAVVLGAQRLALDAEHLVFLAPGVEHSVEPEPGTDLVILVTHAGKTPTRKP